MAVFEECPGREASGTVSSICCFPAVAAHGLSACCLQILQVSRCIICNTEWHVPAPFPCSSTVDASWFCHMGEITARARRDITSGFWFPKGEPGASSLLHSLLGLPAECCCAVIAESKTWVLSWEHFCASCSCSLSAAGCTASEPCSLLVIFCHWQHTYCLV